MTAQLLRLGILFISLFSQLLYWAIFIYILLSWISRRKTPFSVFLHQVVTPLLRPFRWARLGMIDFSPLVALIAIQLLSGWLTEYLVTFL